MKAASGMTKYSLMCFWKTEDNVVYEALLGIGAEILAIAFAGMVQMIEFPKGQQ